MPSSADAAAKNMEAIRNGLVQHNGNWPDHTVLAILMNPHEVERLDLDEFMGIPIEGDASLGTGMFRLKCDAEHEKPEAETDAVAEERTVHA